MNESTIARGDIIREQADVRNEDYLAEINKCLLADNRKIVILDDDPTGTQTVHGIPVLTEWELEGLVKEFKNDSGAFFILTNTRAYSEKEARRINEEIGLRLREASARTGKGFTVISRGDSTLRGHFPGELEALEKSTDISYDGWLLYPYFLEGKRFTVNDIHYVEEKEEWIPVGLTPFAKDSTFGFKSSNIKEYIEEKTEGRVKKDNVVSISIEDIRLGGTERVEEILNSLKDGQICIINSIDMQDVRCTALAVLRAEMKGKRFLYRTSSSFVQARLGQRSKELLKGSDIAKKESRNGGIVFVGSYVPKTTAQLKYLIENSDIVPLEVCVSNLLEDESYNQEVEAAAARADKLIEESRDVVVYTSRNILKTDDPELNLKMSVRISEGLMAIANSIRTTPGYLISKGGITSSDMATKGLKSKRSMVLGQILPGIPVWKLGDESRYPGMAFVIFPGNVGDETALYTAVEKLKARS